MNMNNNSNNKFDLKQFLKNYKPKNFMDNITPYLEILPEYKFYNYKTDILVPGHYYIRYVPEGKSNTDDNLINNVKSGGLFIGLAKKIGNKIIRIEPDKVINTIENDWDYLVLYCNSRNKVYYIKPKTNYIFYKKYKTKYEKTPMHLLLDSLINNDVIKMKDINSICS